MENYSLLWTAAEIDDDFMSTIPVEITRESSRISLLINEPLIQENIVIRYTIQILGFIDISSDLFFCKLWHYY